MIVFYFKLSTLLYELLKGTKGQHNGQISSNIQNLKKIQIQPVRLTELCGKVYSEDNR